MELLAEEPNCVLCVWPSISALSLWSCVSLDNSLDISEFQVIYKVGGGITAPYRVAVGTE